MSDYRGTGRTTQQMTDAPLGAVFVWCNSALHYPEALARQLGRDDLVIRRLSWLERRNVMGRTFPGVIVDHAAHCDAEAYEALNYLRTRGVLVAG
jgi:hypothetical protein